MRAEYDLRSGVRAKYFERYRHGTTVVLLEPDVGRGAACPSPTAVGEGQ